MDVKQLTQLKKSLDAACTAYVSDNLQWRILDTARELVIEKIKETV